MVNALETYALTKRFSSAAPAVVDGVSMTVPRGAVYGFLGANGAGKTTTLKLVLGLSRPDAGTIHFFGEAARRGARDVGSLIETPCAYDHLTGRQNLDLTRRLLDLPRFAVSEVLEIVDLSSAADRRVGGYSLGMRQRLGIARALLSRPRLLVLDEPTNGLDPDGIRDMRMLLRCLPESGDVTVIVSSHVLSEVEQVATHVGLLHQGRLLLEAPLETLVNDSSLVEVATTDCAHAAVILRDAGFSVTTDPQTDVLIVESKEPSEIAALLLREGQTLSHLTRSRPSLERLYHRQIAAAA